MIGWKEHDMILWQLWKLLVFCVQCERKQWQGVKTSDNIYNCDCVQKVHNTCVWNELLGKGSMMMMEKMVLWMVNILWYFSWAMHHYSLTMCYPHRTFVYFYIFIMLCWSLAGNTNYLLGKATAAARAALPNPTSVYNIFVCSNSECLGFLICMQMFLHVTVEYFEGAFYSGW